jgi:hypothetical protein
MRFSGSYPVVAMVGNEHQEHRPGFVSEDVSLAPEVYRFRGQIQPDTQRNDCSLCKIET